MSGPFRDSIEGIHPKSRSRSGWFVLVLILFVIGGFYYTLDKGDVFVNHDASEDFSSLVYGFQSLGYGDVQGFLEGIFGGLTIVALFMVLFALMHFLFSTALKPVFPKKKYATIMALVMTAYGFIDYRIYNYLLNLNAFAVAFFVFILVVVMLWSFAGKSGKDAMNSFKDISVLKNNPELINDKKYVKELKELIERERRERK